ncbi:hypothetical protein [Actinomadura meridiana]|uniref:hypothetical protein n=1 Tax=Actinomadura meridiana TaxID=559626 RepID=UPI0031EE9CA4
MTSPQELARLLAEQQTRADASIRELERRADRAGGPRLPRATCADILAGHRFPKKAVMVAFLRACGVPEDQLPRWERAWERVAIAQGRPLATPDAIDPATTEVTEPAAPLNDEPPEQDHPDRTSTNPVSRRRLRPGRSAALATIAAATIAAAAFVVLTDTFGSQNRPQAAPPPDTSAGRSVTDDGRAFGPGGSSRFTVTVDPRNTGVRLTRRLDAGIAEQTASITVEQAPAGAWQPLPVEPTYRWKDQSIDISPSLTAGRRSLTIVNTFVSSAEDFNEFIYFIDHKVNGIWSRADTVNVGPDHPASEAAHHYRVTGLTYAGTRTFDYPK